ncbi:MAG TPA: DUF4912 domain-containing protein [Candidatus Bathyarchaeia archaeon]|nr:DUF4912 domain-containing protein [Candidatus Bathyarchaeia archaeon]
MVLKKKTNQKTIETIASQQGAPGKASAVSSRAKRVALKKSVAETSVTKTVRKTAVRKPANPPVSNEKLNGMIRDNLLYASKARRPVFVDSEVMPAEYGSTNITLLTRDPHWVHAYWEICPSSIEQVRQKIGDAVNHSARVLRVYDVTFVNFTGNNANHWFDIDVGPFANNWYINLWSDNITCCVDIGLRTPEGVFHTLARSNFVTTPREQLSPRNELIWMDVAPAPMGRDEGLRGEGLAGEGGEAFFPRPYIYVGRKVDGLEVVECKRKDGRRFRMYLTEEDIKAYYSRLFPLLSKILSRRRRSKKGVPSGIDADRDDLRAFDDFELEYLEDMDMLGYEYFKKILLGASEEMMLKRRTLFDLLTGASEQISSWAGASERQPPPKDFFFELGTELIVYGRTEPDAVVYWGDRVIPLRQDGTFTLRMALPTDTHIPLDFKAVSYVKELQRTITTGAGREKTVYGN